MSESNSKCFDDISWSYDQWCNYKGPGFIPGVYLFLAIGVVLLGVSLRTASLPIAIATILVIGLACAMCYEGPADWVTRIDADLNKYQPVNIDAFVAFQESVKVARKLEKETLGRWIEVERKSRIQRSTSGMTFTERDIEASTHLNRADKVNRSTDD